MPRAVGVLGSIGWLAALLAAAAGATVQGARGRATGARRERLAGDSTDNQSFLQIRAADEEEPLSCAVELLRKLPHVGQPFTQGLELTADGQLVETTGDYPPGVGSFVRTVDPHSGSEASRTIQGLRQRPLPASPVFLEGITELGGHWFASTYEDNVLLEYDSSFQYLKSHAFPYEGWGLTHSVDGKFLFATNSTEYVMTLDAKTFDTVDTKTVTCLGKRVPGLNELEMVPDFLGRGPAIVGNIIYTRLVLAVDPATARCFAVFQLAGGGLERQRSDERYGYHVANGIAFNRQSGTFFVTGKNWRNMFEVRVTEDPHRGTALEALRQHLSTSLPATS